ncbi:phage baseplate assembly protein V [Escherichia coli]|uniref:phage baseplate assembly protein V n=2 Tax=Escherichia coli TaxID=562 RepID=UPI00255CC53B|nr:phage baseplate assembly protein V [Escherichia coli]
MNTLANIQELARALRNMIRTGLVVETNLKAGRCRVQTGGMCTDWLQWLTCRAGRSRTWWAPSVGEQVLILAVGGELDTAFVLPGIYSGDNPAPSASADALHIRFPDGAVIEYEPETSALTVAEFSISLATGRADIYTETPVRVSGFKRVIDEQDWAITKVTHFLNNSGFTTSLELEVRLSDVEYETEDNE